MRRSIAAVMLAGLLVVTGANPASAYVGPWTSAAKVSTAAPGGGVITHGQGYYGSSMRAYTKWSAHYVCIEARYMLSGSWEYHDAECEGTLASITDWAQITQHRPSY